MNFNNILQLQVYHGATEGRDQRAHESLEERLGNQITATPTYLSPAQSLLRQKMFHDAKEHSQLVATTIEGEIHRFSLPPTPSPDHFIQLGPVFGELEEQHGLLLDSRQLHIILRQSVVRVLSNTKKRPPLHSKLVRVSFLGLFFSVQLLARREDPLQSLQRVSDAGRRELEKGISQWLVIQFVHDIGQYLFEKLQYRDAETGLCNYDGVSIDEIRQSMGNTARFSPSGRYPRMLLPEAMPKNTSPKVQPVHGYESEMASIPSTPQTVAITVPTPPAAPPAPCHYGVDNHVLAPSPIGKYSMREPGNVGDGCDWKDQSTKPAATTSQYNSTESPRQLDPASVTRKSIEEEMRRILTKEMPKTKRTPGTVCLTPAHTREGSYKIYHRREKAARRGTHCYSKQDPVWEIQCKSTNVIKKLVLAEFTGQTKTLECGSCGQKHKDWIAAADMDIKASIRSWAKLLETEFEDSQVPNTGFSQDTHRWRRWASETAELKVVKGPGEKEPQDKDPPLNVEEGERSMNLQAQGLKVASGGQCEILPNTEVKLLFWCALWMCLCALVRFLLREMGVT